MEQTDSISQDFQRDVYCLFGLPVDNLTLEQTKALLRKRAAQEGSTVLSTINVNWVAQSFRDPDFREAILNSDIVTLDGKPLLWFAKLLGFPMTEVVAGSSLIQELHQDKAAEKPLTIFFFGGEERAAEMAHDRVNSNSGGLKSVGFLNPGFGTVVEMSSPEIIDAINQTKPDILLVALGAKKGTQWIERNRHRLNAKIISHLGATINFLAGTIQRAPKIVRKLGLEWVWRILQEPYLFPRYARDGLVLLRLISRRFFLWLQFLVWQKHFKNEGESTGIQIQENDQEISLTLGRLTKDSPMCALFSRCVCSEKNLILDFQGTKFADGAFLGLLLILMKQQKRSGRKLALRNLQSRLAKIFSIFCVEHVQVDRSN